MRVDRLMKFASADTQPPHGWIAAIKADIDCVFLRDPAARTRWEVLTTYPGVHALLAHRLAHALWQRGWRYPARLLSFLVRLVTQIDIHPGARIGRRLFIDHGSGVVIGETAEIGDDVTLYHGVTLGGVSWNPGKRHPTLGKGVVVGAGAKILGPIHIGANVRVGANSVVIGDVPAGMTVVGIPGRVVLPVNQRRITRHGIDLDHHLMPDPVGKAVACLLERLNNVESDLAVLKGLPPPQDCHNCEDACDMPQSAAQRYSSAPPQPMSAPTP